VSRALISPLSEALHLTDVALATCSLLPNLDADERQVIPALEACGMTAEARVWDDPAVRWDEFRVVVIRSTWDYAERRDAFLEWAGSLPRVLNTVQVIRWNTDKSYLRALAASGIPVVPTTWVKPDAGDRAFQLPEGNLVVKPAVSSGAQNTSRYGPGDHRAARTHVERLLAEDREVMVQPYVPSVDANGETGLIYIDGVFSHAVRKGALLRAPGVATDELWAREDITPRTPGEDERAVAEAVLDALPWSSLFLGLGSGAALRLAEGIARRLGTD